MFSPKIRFLCAALLAGACLAGCAQGEDSRTEGSAFSRSYDAYQKQRAFWIEQERQAPSYARQKMESDRRVWEQAQKARLQQLGNPEQQRALGQQSDALQPQFKGRTPGQNVRRQSAESRQLEKRVGQQQLPPRQTYPLKRGLSPQHRPEP